MSKNFNLTQTGEEVQHILDTATPVTDLQQETQARQQADTLLQQNIDAESVRAQQAEQQEAQARQQDISALAAQITQTLTDYYMKSETMSAEEIQTLVSETIASYYTKLQVDALIQDFITASVSNLTNYYLKTETFTKTEVQQLIAAVKQFRYQSVAMLPTASAETMNIIYLVPSDNPKAENVKDEFITTSQTNEQGVTTYQWEQIGSTTVDLSGYSTTEQMNAAISQAIATALAQYYTKSETMSTAQVNAAIEQAVNTAIANYYTKSQTDAAITTALASYYTKAQADDAITAAIATALAAYYTKTEVNALLDTIRQSVTAETNARTDADATLRGLIQQVSTSLVNYYLKTETYSKSEVQQLVNAVQQFQYVVAASLPANPGPDTMGIIYLIPSTNPKTQNIKDEFITVLDGSAYKWEQIGSTTVDLSGYSTTEQMNAAIASALASYYTKAQVDSMVTTINAAIAQKQDTISDLATIRSGAAAGATALQPAALTPYSTTTQMNTAISNAVAAEKTRAEAAEGANADAIAALQDIVADIETVAEGYVRVAGSSSPALSYRSYKYHEQGGFGRESVFSLFYPCLVGTKLSGDDAQVGTVLFVLKKLGARVATAEDTAFTEGQAVWEDINGNLHAIDGSEGDVMICNIEPYYSIDGRHTIDGTEYDVFLKSRTPFTWQGIEAVLIDKMGMSPDYCVSHQDEDGVTRMHSVYNPAWNGSYTAPVGVVGKIVYTTDPETGDIVETYDAEATLLGGAGGLHSTDISLPDGEQRAMNMNPDTTKTVPFMNQTAEACNRMQALLLSEGGTFDAHNANLMGSGFSTNDAATAAGDWEQAGSGAKNGMRYIDKTSATRYAGFSHFESGSQNALKLPINSFANIINSWRNPWHVMEAQRAVSYAVQNDVHELEWFTFEGNKYKYRSVSGFNGPSHGEMTCVVWKMLSTKFTSAAKDPSDGTTSLEGNRVDFLVSTALLHGVTTQVSPSWWVSGLIFTEDENGQYECYIERDQHALMKSPTGDYDADQVIPFEEHYEHLANIQKGEGYARNYLNEALMMPDTNANKSGAGLHTYVGKYNWFSGGNAPAGKRGVRGFRRGNFASYSILSPLSMFGYSSPSNADSYIGFGICCSLR